MNQQLTLFEDLVQDTHKLLLLKEGLEEQYIDVVVKIGRNLIQMRPSKPYGQFLPWVKSEFEMSPQSAHNYIHVAEVYGSNAQRVVHLPLRVVYELAAPLMPNEVRERVETGQIPATLPAIREAKQEIVQGTPSNVLTGFGRTLTELDNTPVLPVLPVTPQSYVPPAQPKIDFSQWQADNLALGLDRFGDVIEEEFYPAPVEVIERPQEAPEPVLSSPVVEYSPVLSTPPAQPYRPIVEPVVLQEDKERRDAHVMRVMGSSDSPEWYTPQEIVQLTCQLFGQIDLDPCSNNREYPNVPARVLYTKEDDGLSRQWEGKVYLNPPYGGEIPRWIQKLIASYEHGVDEAIALLPARIDTVWFQPLYAYLICNVKGRIQFENSPYHAPFPCVIVYLGKREEAFIDVFKSKGPIMRRIA